MQSRRTSVAIFFRGSGGISVECILQTLYTNRYTYKLHLLLIVGVNTLSSLELTQLIFFAVGHKNYALNTKTYIIKDFEFRLKKNVLACSQKERKKSKNIFHFSHHSVIQLKNSVQCMFSSESAPQRIIVAFIL